MRSCPPREVVWVDDGEKRELPHDKRHTGRFYLKTRTVTDMINFLVQEGSSYLESVCAEGGDGVSG